jgi:putative endonuclease
VSANTNPQPATADGRKQLGGFGERLARAHLEAKGYAIVDRNFRTRECEIDLVARDGDVVVFVEVRTRRGAYDGMAALSVTRGKQRKLRAAVERYAEAHPDVADAPLRIDVVTVDLGRDGKLREVAHYEDAVRG